MAVLANLFVWWASVKMRIYETLHTTHRGRPQFDTTRHKKIATRMERLGLDGYDTPAVLYSAAGYRKTSREEDRVYGIMQVFGFKLGKSSEPKRELTLSDLELQIAAALNAKSPIWAQLFSHMSIPPRGKHWCISQGSRTVTPLVFVNLQSQCRIRLDAQDRAVFEGKRCSFSQLAHDWHETKKLSKTFARPTFWAQQSGEVLQPLDVCEFSKEHVPPELFELREVVDPRQDALTRILVERLGEDVEVLLLGTLLAVMDEDEDEEEDISNESDASVGMIVRRITRGADALWQRIGIAVWAHIPDTLRTDGIWHSMTALLD